VDAEEEARRGQGEEVGMQPSSFGLPQRFESWRRNQFEAMTWASSVPQRFVALNMPVGSGKSLVYMTAGVIADPWKVCVLTSTRGLQDQLLRDFGEIGLVDVRGQSNYVCKLEADEGRDWVKVDQGICHLGVSCIFRVKGCHYHDAVRRAAQSRLVETNYPFWLTCNAYGEGLGRVDMLVMDEAHEAPNELADFLAIRISKDDAALIGHGTPEQSKAWLEPAIAAMESRKGNLVSRVPKIGRPTGALFHDIRAYEGIITRLKALTSVGLGWVMDTDEDGWRWDVVDVSTRAESMLFQGASKVLFTSATVTPRTLALLGIAPDAMAYKEWPSTFPVDRRPVIHIPTVRMRYDMDPQELKHWVGRIDQILSKRQDRRGIIHTVSYARRDYLLKHSSHANLMLTHGRNDTRHVVERFKAGDTPPCLVSPSLSTGWDFPYMECEYQIVGKVAFPDTRSKVMQARVAADKGLRNYIAATDLVQSVGRGMRAADDQCETFVIDDSVEWLVRRNRDLFPKWFRESFRTSAVVPVPIQRLRW
jgi:ATP-dependent DNA helicase DinG